MTKKMKATYAVAFAAAISCTKSIMHPASEMRAVIDESFRTLSDEELLSINLDDIAPIYGAGGAA